jgi:hypothetical protein
VSLRHHDPQRQNVIEAGFAIELSSQIDKRTDYLSSVLLLFFSCLQQRNAPPPGHAPPVLGTREWPCPHCPRWEPENGRARSTCARDQRVGQPSVTDPARHPPRLAWWVEIRESGSVGPGPVVRL